MEITLCDLCPNDLSLVRAQFHLEFTRIKDDSWADRSVDLCKMHYEVVYEFIENRKKTSA